MENIQTLLAAVAQTQGFDDDESFHSASPAIGFRNSENREETGGSELNGPPTEVLGESLPQREVVLAIRAAEDKRKRGRPARGQMVAKPPPPKRKKQEDEEEDVCFICFDGGSLVLCDRKPIIQRVLSEMKPFLNLKQSGIAVGTYAVYVGGLRIICATVAPIHCARDALKIQILCALEGIKAFARLA
ncbi:hypothetical protein RD792_008660 [Penstemon davidsonii]|uniref:Uncharacterized protein n=1 Tax=Penstemon davidsonii TaxID=160366 RepID=A0ABR0DA11_9LAMI|nr:hypothetical protein RD792_008660 [Penstemon davidsonii]